MVEPRAVNAGVVGSSPTGAAIYLVAGWTNRQVTVTLKSWRGTGSSPTPGIQLLPCGVTGSISDFDSDGLGSKPGGAAK